MNSRNYGMNIHYFLLLSILSTDPRSPVTENNVACKFEIKLKTRVQYIAAPT